MPKTASLLVTSTDKYWPRCLKLNANKSVSRKENPGSLLLFSVASGYVSECLLLPPASSDTSVVGAFSSSVKLEVLNTSGFIFGFALSRCEILSWFWFLTLRANSCPQIYLQARIRYLGFFNPLLADPLHLHPCDSRVLLIAWSHPFFCSNFGRE